MVSPCYLCHHQLKYLEPTGLQGPDPQFLAVSSPQSPAGHRTFPLLPASPCLSAHPVWPIASLWPFSPCPDQPAWWRTLRQWPPPVAGSVVRSGTGKSFPSWFAGPRWPDGQVKLRSTTGAGLPRPAAWRADASPRRHQWFQTFQYPLAAPG